MKRLLAFFILAGLVYGGWVFYEFSRSGDRSVSLRNLPSSTEVVISDSQKAWDNLESVLGASIGRAITTGRDWVDEATAGQAEPIVNRAVSNFQEELKQLPADQVEKIKYDFCKPIVTDYEKDHTP